MLMAWIADLEEVLDLLGLQRNTCPKCVARYKDLGGNWTCECRTGKSILSTLRQLCDTYPKATTWQFAAKVRDMGLLGVEDLCWEGLSVDICHVICLDLLHGLHKYISDHPKKWIENSIGKDALDARFIAQPYWKGHRTFQNGISKISQWSGQENHDLQHHLAIAVAGAYNSKGSVQYSPHMMQATHSLLDFSYKAQFPAHSNVSLQLMIKDLKTYYSSIKVFIDNGVCCNAKGNTIHHF